MEEAQRALLVDDDPMVLRLLSKILGTTYPTDTAESVAVAKERLSTRPYDLILTDLRMPGESGLDLIDFVRAAYPHTAIVVVSGISEADEAKNILDAGVYGYIVKPFEPNQLRIAVENALIRRKLEMRQQLDQETLQAAVATKTAELEGALWELRHAKQQSDLLAQNVHNQLFFVNAMMNAMPCPMFYKDIQGRYLGCNTAFCEFMRRPLSEIIGKSIHDLAPDELAAEFHQNDLELIRNPGKQSFEKQFVHPDGSVSDIVVSKAAYLDASGAVAGIVGVILDISSLKKAEQELENAHKEMVKLVSGITSIFIGLSPALTIVQWNRVAEKLMNLPIAEVLHTCFWDAKIPWDWDRIREGVRRCMAERQPVDLTVVIERLDGKNGFLGLRMTATESDPEKPTGILIMGADITERRILESQLAQAQKLESIGQLAAGIAHEINTPIQYVGDNIRFMKDAFDTFLEIIRLHEPLLAAGKAGTCSAERIRELEERLHSSDFDYFAAEVPNAIEQTLEGVARIGKIVRSMKEFSHPGIEEMIAVDINHCLECTIDVSRNEWKYVAEMETDFDPSLPLVPCYPGELNQVFLNIIVNAAHAIEAAIAVSGEEKGRIRVATRNGGEVAEIRISDTGGGVPEAIRHRIFDPFFTTKEVGKGTGQGLAIAHRIVVEKHGGAIRLESTPEKGALFVLRIPYRGVEIEGTVR